jgi:hypothetical protein
MKTSSIVIVLLVAIFYGCGLLESDWIVERMRTQDVEIPPEVNMGESIVFTVDSYLPDTCWKFRRLRIISSGFDVYVTPYMMRSRNETICFLVCTPIAEEGVFTPVFPGEYRFHFWHSDTLSLDYTVIVR